ncbi:MAG: hypothetical protein Q7S72_02040 [Candidatus Taylorbacteria bacterium]|nr:hypothetical protein [Candidatus Taylorbacteria bacterium]
MLENSKQNPNIRKNMGKRYSPINTRNTAEIYLSAPNCGCKGSSAHHALHIYPELINVIGTGKLARDRGLIDPEFAAIHQTRKAKKQLIPTEIIMPMAMGCYRDGILHGRTIHIFDGLPRCADQVTALAENGLLNPINTLFVIIHSTLEMCRCRRDDPSALSARSGRIEDKIEEDFEFRYKEYYDLLPGIMLELDLLGVRPVHVDGNDRPTADVNNEVIELIQHIMPTPMETVPARQSALSRALAGLTAFCPEESEPLGLA